MLDNFQRATVGYDNIEKHDKEIWNAAIEAAASKLENDFDFLGEELLAAIEIRKLKK